MGAGGAAAACEPGAPLRPLDAGALLAYQGASMDQLVAAYREVVGVLSAELVRGDSGRLAGLVRGRAGRREGHGAQRGRACGARML